MATGVHIVSGKFRWILLSRSESFRGVDFADTEVQQYGRALRAAIREILRGTHPAHLIRLTVFVKNHSIDHLRVVQRIAYRSGFAREVEVQPAAYGVETRFSGHCLGTLHSTLSGFMGAVFHPRWVEVTMILQRLGVRSAEAQHLIVEYVGLRLDVLIVATIFKHFWRQWVYHGHLNRVGLVKT